MLMDEVAAFTSAVHRRNGAAEGTRLILARCYGGKITATEADELLTCRRIARKKVEAARIKGAVCV